jgi:DNA-directed RNA polymerase beta' subunit
LYKIAANGLGRLRAIIKFSENQTVCVHCGENLHRFELTKKDEIRMFSLGRSNELFLSAKDVYDIFTRITNEDVSLLGFNRGLKDINAPVTLLSGKTHPLQVRPESFIFTALPVIPPAARPYVVRRGVRHDDSLTTQYGAVLKVNEKLSDSKNGKTKKEHSEFERRKLTTALQADISALIDNHNAPSTPGVGWKLKGLCDRIQGKTGHVNANIEGKRVDHSARTVIVGGGLEIPFGWVGVPQVIAEELSHPVTVTQFNKLHLEDLVNKQRKCNVIVRNGVIIRINRATRNYTKYCPLQIGDVVMRFLQDGDWVLFNRQPTLRKESIMAKRIKVMHGDILAFRLPLEATRPYGADETLICLQQAAAKCFTNVWVNSATA